MIQYSSIKTFRKRLEELLVTRRKVYASVAWEVYNDFNGKSIDQIRDNRDLILVEDVIIVVKLRLPDKKQHLSKKDGYRLIYLVFKDKEEVVFLDIYPKNGPKQQLNIKETEIVRLLEEYVEQFQKGSLVFHQLDGNLTEII